MEMEAMSARKSATTGQQPIRSSPIHPARTEIRFIPMRSDPVRPHASMHPDGEVDGYGRLKNVVTHNFICIL
jgi:hypothetical protein